jgi:hypothetical protein
MLVHTAQHQQQLLPSRPFVEYLAHGISSSFAHYRRPCVCIALSCFAAVRSCRFRRLPAAIVFRLKQHHLLLFRIFGDCTPHSTHDETFLVLGHLFRLCRSTMTPDLAAHLSLCLTHRYTVKSSACSTAQLQLAEVVSNGDPSVLAEVLDSCLNYDFEDNDVTLHKLKLVQLCVSNLSPRASVNVADILLDSRASCQGLLLHIDSKIHLKSLAILNAIGVCAVSAISLLVSDELPMQPAPYMLLEAHLFNPHYIALR